MRSMLRVAAVDRFVVSSLGSRPSALQKSSVSRLPIASKGRSISRSTPSILRIDEGRIPWSPARPLPLTMFIKIVSAWSSAVCPKTTALALWALLTLERNSYRTSRAAASTERRRRARTSSTSTASEVSGIPSEWHWSATKAASAVEAAPRRPWSRWAQCSRSPSLPLSLCSAWSNESESGPPDTAITSRSVVIAPHSTRAVRTCSTNRSGEFTMRIRRRVPAFSST